MEGRKEKRIERRKGGSNPERNRGREGKGRKNQKEKMFC